MSEKDFSGESDRAPGDAGAAGTTRVSGPEAAPTTTSPRPVDPAGEFSGGRELAFDQAALAYSIINALLEHTRVTSDLIALMAQVIDEETTKALTQTPYWSAYLDSRRAMERTRREVEEFARVWTRLAEGEPPPEA